MKAAKKKMMIGTVAAAVIVGGAIAGILHNQAYADSATPSVSSGQNGANGQSPPNGQHGFGGRGGGQGPQGHGPKGPGPQGAGPQGNGPQNGFGRGPGPGGDLVQITATVLGKDVQTVIDATKQGKTLTQIAQDQAGLSEDAYLQKLTAVIEKNLTDAVSAGKLTQAQADQQKTGLADRLKAEVEQTHPNGPGPGRRGHGGPEGMLGNPDTIAQTLGVTKDELDAARQAGKSLAEIAADKGITEDQLITKLKDSMTDQLKQFVENKGMPKHNGAPDGQPQPQQPGAAAAPSPTATQN